MRLILLHPQVANRTCADCQQWMHDDRNGELGGLLLRRGERIPRGKGVRTPCVMCPKIPPGREPSPDNAVELSPHNSLAYQHYLECRAVGVFPDDPIVRRNAAAIRQAEDLAERRSGVKQLQTLLKVLRG